MGRSIYADEVGSTEDKNNQWVHKFWFAVQDSDISEYLHMYEPSCFLADLSTENEADIKEKVDELKAEFEKQYSMTYEAFSESVNGGYSTEDNHQKLELASRIDLGENLLKTIENMKTAGISDQQLTIEC